MAYIDKDLLLKDISESVVFSVKGSCSPEFRGARKIIDRIKNAPTAGVAEVKHGEWICLEAEIGLYCCSLCEHKILRTECNYCPECGAKMDGERRDT